MGGVAVATADLSTAPWANPSLLSRQELGDKFSLLIGLGAFVRDDEDLIGDIDDFQDADDAREDAQDAGDAAIDLSENWLLGLSLRYLIEEDSDVGSETLDFDTEAAIGIAYRSRSVTIGIDTIRPKINRF